MGVGGRCLELVRAMYSRVVRTLLVDGSFTDDFGVDVGVAQGSVLSPFLYAVYINGLHCALREPGLGMFVFGRRVPLLLYADDIVLLARSGDELQAMLDVVSRYAQQWRFTTNHGKSNVVVMGTPRQRELLGTETWFLGGRRLKVVREYKYLGAESGMSSGSRGRWNSMLGRLLTKTKQALAGLMHQCGGADGLRPRTSTLHWRGAIMPLAEYACELWEGEISGEWERKLESVQYRFAKAALGLHGTPSAVGVRRELGLTEWKFRRQSLKLRWWGRMCSLPAERLLSLLFRRRHAELAAGGARFSGLRSMRSLLHAYGFDAEWGSRSVGPDPNAWLTLVQEATSVRASESAAAALASSSLLSNYVQYRVCGKDGIARYLDDRANIQGTRLLTKCRLGWLLTMAAVAKMMKWPEAGAQCLLCGEGAETVQHFVQECPFLECCRTRMMSCIAQSLPEAGSPGRAALHMVQASRAAWARTVLEVFTGSGPSQEVALAAWLFDCAAKNMLLAMWKLREASIGHVSVAQQRLVVCPPGGRTASELRSRQCTPVNWALVAPAVGVLEDWTLRPADERVAVRHKRSGRSAFFVVWVGRFKGIFTSWAECSRQVQGYPGARFAGCQSLAEAHAAVARGPRVN